MNYPLMSENINELMAALSKAQGKIQHASKDKSNPFFKSKYADLASIWEACREPLSDNGLAVAQTIFQKPEGMVLITTLGHSSGQWIKSEMPVIVAKNDPQTIGSAITYYRRYSLSAMVGVAPNDDDDGEKAQSSYRNQKVEEKTVMSQSQKISPQQASELENILGECDTKYKQWVYESIKKQYGSNNVSDLPLNKFEGLKSGAIKNMEANYEKQRKESQLVTQEVQ
jgi:ERF superfamily